MAYRALSIREQSVQDLLWQHIDPTDIHPEYTKLDAILHIANQCHAGTMFLWGDETALLRCEGNVYTGVVTPHILGDGKKFRSLLTEGCEYARQQGWSQVHIWTARGTIQKLAERMGFDYLGGLPAYHPKPTGGMLASGKPECYAQDIAIMGMKL